MIHQSSLPSADPALTAQLLDPRLFIESCFFLVDKESRKSPFKFNYAQSMYYESRSRNDIILKARKMGFSSLIGALWLHACLTRENTRAVIVSHESEATERLLRRVKYLIDNCILPIRTRKNTASEIEFPETSSYLYIGTAGARAFGRGDDLTHCHLSEAAWYESFDVVTGVQEALLKDSWFVMETTANGAGTSFHEAWKRSKSGESSAKPHFFAWFQDPGNQIPSPPFEADETEAKLQRVFNLSWPQLAWRRDKLRNMADPKLYLQEHPSTPEEAFLASGRMVLDWEAIKTHEDNAAEPKWRGRLNAVDGDIRMEPDPEGALLVYKTPDPRGVYLITGDASMGIIGLDLSVADVWDARTGEQVAQWRGYCPPRDFTGHVLWRLGAWYNWATIAQENNYPGNAVCMELSTLHYPNLYRYAKSRSGEHGFKTTEATKQAMVADAQAALRGLDIKVNSKYTIAESRTYVVNDDGTIGAQAGCHDDTMTTLISACYILKRMAVAPEEAFVVNRGGMTRRRYRELLHPASPPIGPGIV